jgi:sugar lactone lactonase YvrE
MRLSKRWLFIVILVLTLGSITGWSLLTPSHAAAVTPTPAPTAASDEINFNPSPDGRWTAIVNTTAGSLDLQQPDGQTVNIFPPGSTVNAVTWSPDSQFLLVVKNNWTPKQPLGTGVEVKSPIEIWGVAFNNNEPGEPARLYQSQAAPDEGPQQIVLGQWSPDSRHMLFWEGILSASILADGLPLFVLDITGGEVKPVTAEALLNPRYQSWAPDSSSLAVTAGGYRSAQVNKWLILFDPLTGQATTAISQTEQIPGTVAWSPKGDLIAYAAVPAEQTGDEWADLMTFDNPAIAGRRIYLLDPVTGKYRRLNDSASYQDAPVWSRDGTKLYYVQRNGDELTLMATTLATGQTEAIPNASQPVDLQDPMRPAVGYYGQFGREELLAYLPADQAATANTSTLDLFRFIFKKHPPVLGTLAEAFLKKVEAGQYTDFSVQEADLTGDGQPESVVSGRAEGLYLFAAILIRDPAGDLRELFHTENIEGKYLAQVRTRVDGSRVVADFLTSTGGTGYLETTWEQRWIECQADGCAQVWSGPLLTVSRSVTWTAARDYTLTELEQPDVTSLSLTTRRFGLKDLPLNDTGSPPGSARRMVGPDTLAIYRRAKPGEIYQLESQTQLAPGQEIAQEFDWQSEESRRLLDAAISQPFYQADGSFDNDGFLAMQAELWGLPAPDQPDDPAWGSASRQLDIAAHSGPPGELGEWVAGLVSALDTSQCRLTVLHHDSGKFQPAGRLDLPCTANLTHLAWLDVTGDGQAELLLLTIPPDAEIAGKVQRLYVYTITDNRLSELATLDGAINGADGAGIRWESTLEGFKVEAGLPLIDPEANPSLSDLRLERQFQTYVWDEGSKGFRVAE